MKPITATRSRFISAFLIACVLSGCAAMSETECRNSDWYALGERDGLTYGLRPQIDQYAELCAKHGVQPAQNEYLAGWFFGERERGVRMGGENP
jgi:Protein of unknown function (DUF2799)